MNKLAYIKYSHQQANQKIWNLLMSRFGRLKNRNKILAFLWFPVACLFFGCIALLSWFSLFAFLFKDIQFDPHYMRTVILYNKLDQEDVKEYLDKQFGEYKNKVSYGNISISKQSQINATFDLLYKAYTDRFNEKNISSELSEKTVKDFRSTLNIQQIELLVECINTIKVFENTITIELIRQILSCSINLPLKIAAKKNKLLIYLFTELSNHSYIVREWQAVCAKNKLFLTSEKGIPLNQTIISTTVNTNLDNPPKDSHIIDKYIKQIQEH